MSNPTKQDWIPHKLNDLGFLGRGKSKHRPRNDSSLYGGKYPFFQTGDVKTAEMYLSNYTQTYNEKGLAQSKIWKAGTLCITIAANIAETAILAIDGCFPDSIVGFVADADKCDVRFIKYYIDFIKLNMQSISRGTTQDNLSLDKLLTFNFATPPLPTQRKIASVLSAYDDLIENNTRRIQILEEMSQRIYWEWFVHFRFPGHKKVGMVESELGPVPEGWKVAHLNDMVEFIRGIEPGSKNYLKVPTEDTVPFLRVGDFGSRGADLYIPLTLTKGKLLEEKNIAISLDGTVGIVRRGLTGCYSTGIRKVVVHDSDRMNDDFLYFLLQSEHIQGIIRTHAKGSTILHAGSSVEHMRFVLPPMDIMVMFDQQIAPMSRRISLLERVNTNLRRTRDLLLPKLISGEVSVEARSNFAGVSSLGEGKESWFRE